MSSETFPEPGVMGGEVEKMARDYNELREAHDRKAAQVEAMRKALAFVKVQPGIQKYVKDRIEAALSVLVEGKGLASVDESAARRPSDVCDQPLRAALEKIANGEDDGMSCYPLAAIASMEIARAALASSTPESNLQEMQSARSEESGPHPAQGAWNWLASRTNLELAWDEVDEGESAWMVHRVGGGRNDREWDLIASGETPLDAVQAARVALDAPAEARSVSAPNTFEVGKPAPYFCPACQAVPRAGYCKLAGCPTAPRSEQAEGGDHG